MDILQREIDPSLLSVIQSFSLKGFHLNEIETKIILSRIKNKSELETFLKTYFSNKFPEIDSPLNLTDMSKAVTRVLKAITEQEKVVIACDYDADGLGAASVIKLGLQSLGLSESRIHICISERYTGGYGFNDSVVNTVLNMNERPTLIITVDEGSSDHLRIKKIAEEDQSIDVIVTDHHHVPLQEPIHAFAFINPNRPNDNYQHKNICGATVAFLLIKALNDLKPQGQKIDLKPLMDIVAISTIGDVMPLNEALNRAIILFALKRANSKANQPLYWKVYKEHDLKSHKVITEDTIGFSIAPKINAMSRIGQGAMHVINFLTSPNEQVVIDAFSIMSRCNEERKEIDSTLYEESVSQMKEQESNFSNVIFLPNGVSGVTGIVASRIKEETGKPTITFCTKADDDTLITGSGRSAGDVDIRLVIERISELFKLCNFGGHPMACGLTIQKNELQKFRDMFNLEVARQTKETMLTPTLEYDFQMGTDALMDEGFIYLIDKMGPFGQLFPKPNVMIEGTVLNTKLLNGGHLRGTIIHEKEKVDFIWFVKKIGQKNVDYKPGQKVQLIGKASVNEFMNKRTIQIIVEFMETI